MRDYLPNVPRQIECGIINLDDSGSSGTHWTCYMKNNNNVFYFDSYGYYPPKELEQYFINQKIVYSSSKIQNFNDPPICGHLCLETLRLSQNKDFNEIEKILTENKYTWLSWFY